jgi:hypothetical protein
VSRPHVHEGGFELVGCPDVVGRRGLWIRETPPPSVDVSAALSRPFSRIELAAGREGADSYVCLDVGEILDERKLWELADVISTYRFAAESWDDVPQLLRRITLALESLSATLATSDASVPSDACPP